MKYNDKLMIEFARLCSNKSEEEVETQLLMFKRFWVLFTKDKTKEEMNEFFND